MYIVKNVMCFLWELYWHSGTELIPLFPLPQSRSVKKGRGGNVGIDLGNQLLATDHDLTGFSDLKVNPSLSLLVS